MRHLMLIAVLAGAPMARAHAQPAPARPADQRDKLATVLKQIQAVAALAPLTPEGALAALGAPARPPRVLRPDRRQWTMQPSDLFAGGLILQSGTTVSVTVAPAPGVPLTFEDVAATLLDRPYTLAFRKQPYKGRTRVWVVEHIFQAPAGQLRLQVLPTVPADDPDQVAKAEAEAQAAVTGAAARSARVTSFSVSNVALDPANMQPLAQRRKSVTRGTPPARRPRPSP